MNRSLLLVICDFLILSLLALANFEEPGAKKEEPAEEVVEVEEIEAQEELIEALKLSLEEERASREELSGDLNLTQQELREREEALAEREARLQDMAGDLEQREEERRKLEEERAQLAEQVAQTEAEKEALAEERARQEEAARRAREQALAMERELQEKLAELEESEKTLAELDERKRAAEEANQRLSTELQLSESEKRLIRENLEQVRTEVTLIRAEKERIQEQAGQLAEGVSTLAERSGELVQEVRRSQPKTANSIYSEFLDNQLHAVFERDRPLYLRSRESETRSILVSDGQKTYALFHIENTGLNLLEAADWETLRGRLSASGKAGRILKMSFLSSDPRILAVEINEATAERFGTKVYQLAQEPFRFPEAVLINNNGDYYGESTFTLDSENDRYVQMQTRIMSRLFGEFSPSQGDLVFSKTGELIGIMVNYEYCALIDNFLPVPDRALMMGEDLSGVGSILSEMRQRVNRLPGRLR